MTQISEITKQEFTQQKGSSQEVSKQSTLKKQTLLMNLKGTMKGTMLLCNLILKNPRTFRRFRVMRPGEERYVRPSRQYELPAYRDDMRYCASDEKYLRSTQWCNPREPEVVAMANQLGAYELADYEFADAALEFLRNNLFLEICPFESAGSTLKRGTGSCYHITNVFVALCRAAGIRARYALTPMKLTEEEQNLEFGGMDPLISMFSEVIFFALSANANMEVEGEVYLNGKWVTACPAGSPEMEAVRRRPIKKLGEGEANILPEAVAGQTIYLESLPSEVARTLKFLQWLTPGPLERVNVRYRQEYQIGRKRLEEAGGAEAYDLRAREMYSLLSLRTEFRQDTAIVFRE